MNEIISAISTVGFPIAACIGLGWFAYKAIQQAQDFSRKREEEMQSIIDKQADSLIRIAAALEAISDRLMVINRISNRTDADCMDNYSPRA